MTNEPQQNAVPMINTKNTIKIVKPEGDTIKNAVEKMGVVDPPSLPHGNQNPLFKEKATWNLRELFGRVSRSIEMVRGEADQTRPEPVGSLSEAGPSSTQGYPGRISSTHAAWSGSSRDRSPAEGQQGSRDVLEHPKTLAQSHDISSGRLGSARIVCDACDDEEEEPLQHKSERSNKRGTMEALSSSASFSTERKGYSEELHESLFTLTSASRRDNSQTWIKVGEELVWPESLSSKDGTSQLLPGMDGTILLSIDNPESGGGAGMERLDSAEERAEEGEATASGEMHDRL